MDNSNKSLFAEIKKGFGSDADEIIRLIELGHTVDCAIQEVVCG